MSALSFAPFPVDHSTPCAPPTSVREKMGQLRTAIAFQGSHAVWQSIDLSVRTVVVMLACTQKGEADRIARQPWGSFSQADQIAMAATARLLHGALKDCAALA